jgi:Sec-independent protein translocase protein TatA
MTPHAVMLAFIGLVVVVMVVALVLGARRPR